MDIEALLVAKLHKNSMPAPEPKFIEIGTPDGLKLPGLLYRKPHDRAVVIYLHGNGGSSIFNKQAYYRLFATSLGKQGISFLVFNNRGAQVINKLYVQRGQTVQRKLYGVAYEKIKECVYDIDGAVAFLKKQGFSTIYLVGASTGANKICVYNYYKPRNAINKYVLLAGGDDVGIYYDQLGKARFWRLLREAKSKIKTKQGENLINELIPNVILSCQSFFDTVNPDGDYNVFPFYEKMHQIKLSTKPLFRYFKSIKKPTLVVYGDHDEFAWGDVPGIVQILKNIQPKLTYEIIAGGDHSFSSHEKELGKKMAAWLKP